MNNQNANKSFENTTINHPYLAKAIKQLDLAIKQVESGSIVFMFGPTGVGKSTLAKHLLKKLDKEYRVAGKHGNSDIPAALIEAPYPDAHQFSWKDFYRRALEILHEPAVQNKLDEPRCSVFNHKIRVNTQAPGHALRLAFENALEYRNVKVVIIDEAQHIAKGTTTSGLLEQLDYIKSLANLTKTVIVLVGTYELLSFRNLSGQLSRRSIDVHFPRYRIEIPEEYMIFGGAVRSFASKLPIPFDFELTNIIEDLYVGSLGCVGILKGWLIKAIRRAIEEGDGTLRRKDLSECMYSHDQMCKMIDEVLEGELLLTPPKDSINILRARLGLDGMPTVKHQPVPQAKRKDAPFQRKPVRDSTGMPS
ncbi:MAG TPA: AAA family ATPase [Deltaproteobacteria bacterium]|nr:AAA family ATPase [Deltaproteobacteria bacterium]